MVVADILRSAGECWRSKQPVTSQVSPFHLHYDPVTQPFRCVVLNPPVPGLEDEPEIPPDLVFEPRDSDLYSFLQSKSDVASRFQSFLDRIRNIVVDITGMECLDKKGDLSVAKYSTGDFLLCHDDHVPSSAAGLTRYIAFIYYLVPATWDKTCGGTLDLFHTDEKGYPRDIRVQIVPKRGSLAFFEVNDRSYHQVSKVFADKPRWSFSGWFYGPDRGEMNANQSRHLDPHEMAMYKVPSKRLSVDWINKPYSKRATIAQLREEFAEESVLVLEDFLTSLALRNKVLGIPMSEMELAGPANFRRFYRATKWDGQCFLNHVTGFLRSVAGIDVSDTVAIEYRHFDSSCYTLLASETKRERPSLEITLCLEDTANSSLHYVTEDDHLAEIQGKRNQLSMVLKDEGVMSFVKALDQGRRRDIIMNFEVVED